jgi:serine protease AprX
MGTQGYGTITAPGNDPYVITVGASNDNGDYDRSNDTMATYSSKGPTVIDSIVKPDLVAPGNLVVSAQSVGSALVNEYPANQIPVDNYNPAGSSAYSPYFFTLSGTSMAAPVVSGAAAMLIDGNSALTPDQVKAKLMRTAWRGFPSTATITVSTPMAATYTEHSDIFTIGAGQVDIWAAYNDATMPSGSAASPSVSFNSSNGTVQLQLNSTSAASVIWGTGSALMADPSSGLGTKLAEIKPMPKEEQVSDSNAESLSALSIVLKCLPAFGGTMLAAFTVGSVAQSPSTSVVLLAAQVALYGSSVYLWFRYLRDNS